MRALSLAVSVTAALIASLCMTAPAAAAPALQFTYAHYDSPGSDNGSNKSINGEYVTIKNTTKKTINLKNYTLHDAPSAANKAKGKKWNYAYTFGSVSLAPGASVKVRTGKGTSTSTTRYWGYQRYVWNNDKDTATLRNSKSAVVDTCSWSKRGLGYTKC